MMKTKNYNRIVAILVFIGLPILFWVLGDTPKRSTLKECLSLCTLLAFSLMLMQFYLSRINRGMLKDHKMSAVIKWHKVLGYIFVTVLMLHPFMIVLPRYFESGVDPQDAFMMMLSATDSWGVVLGMIAWCLMVIIGITSIFRKSLPMTYKTWRTIHGILSLLFIVVATMHATELGRHTDKPMTIFMVVAAAGGALLLIRTYFFTTKKSLNHE